MSPDDVSAEDIASAEHVMASVPASASPDEAPAPREPIPPPASAWAKEDLDALTARGLRRVLEPLSSPQGPVIQIGGETLVNFSSNDYLGLARDPRLAHAAAAAMGRHGLGTGASRLVVGDSTAHQALEEKLASFMDAEAARLFNSGYAANVGVLSALVGPGDVIFSDELNHASLIDGCRLSRARTAVYPHGDLKGLDLLLNAMPGRRRIVCTDAVFSMDGDWAPLAGLVELCRKHGAALVVDEAHALGVVGARGAGLCEELGLAREVDVRVATLGKSLGVFGAFVATSKNVAEVLHHKARSLVFSTALPASLCVAASEALAIVETDGELRARLWRNIRRFADLLRELGLPAEAQSPIFAIVLGDAQSAVEASKFLRARGVLVKPIRPPTVPDGTSRLRFSLSAAHTDAHLELAIESLRELIIHKGLTPDAP